MQQYGNLTLHLDSTASFPGCHPCKRPERTGKYFTFEWPCPPGLLGPAAAECEEDGSQGAHRITGILEGTDELFQGDFLSEVLAKPASHAIVNAILQGSV